MSRQSKAYWHFPTFKMRVLCIFLSGNTGQVMGFIPPWVVSLATKLSVTARQLSSFIRSPHCLCLFNQPNFFLFLISTIFEWKIFSRTTCTLLRGFRHILNFSGFLGAAAVSLDHWAGLHLFHPPVSGRLGSLGIHREMKQMSSPPTRHRPPPREDQREAQITQRWCREALSALKPEKMHVLRCGPHSSEIWGICLCAQLSPPSSP